MRVNRVEKEKVEIRKESLEIELEFKLHSLAFFVFLGIHTMAQTPYQASEITNSYNTSYLQDFASSN